MIAFTHGDIRLTHSLMSSIGNKSECISLVFVVAIPPRVYDLQLIICKRRYQTIGPRNLLLVLSLPDRLLIQKAGDFRLVRSNPLPRPANKKNRPEPVFSYQINPSQADGRAVNSTYFPGLTFWFIRKRLLGSYFCLIFLRRS